MLVENAYLQKIYKEERMLLYTHMRTQSYPIFFKEIGIIRMNENTQNKSASAADGYARIWPPLNLPTAQVYNIGVI